MARSEGGRPCGCRRTWHGWSAAEDRAHSLCERGGGGGEGRGRERGGGREREGERGRGRERIKAMGRDYMDMPLLYIWLWLGGGLLHLLFRSDFLKLVCYICTCTLSCISMYMYMYMYIHGNNVHAYIHVRIYMYMQQRYTTTHLTCQKLTCLQVSSPGGLAGDSGWSGRLGRHRGRTCPGTGTGTHAVGSPRQRRGGESRQAVDVLLAPGKGATGSWHFVGE